MDYLSSAFWDNEIERHIGFLERHRAKVLAAESDLQGLDGRAAKYIWLTRYHNSAIKSHLRSVPDQRRDRLKACSIAAAETDLIQDR